MEAAALVAPRQGGLVDDTVAQIKSAVDVVGLVGEFVQLQPFGRKFRGLCPFHQDRSPSLVVDPEHQSWVCWPCDLKGDIFAFLQKIENLDFMEAKRRLAERAGITLSENWAKGSDSRQAIFRALAWAQELFQAKLFDGPTGAAARAYLAERGIGEPCARQFGLGFAPPEFEWLVQKSRGQKIGDATLAEAGLARTRDGGTGVYDYFRGRLMFPIRDDRGRIASFGGRIIPGLGRDDDAKYLNGPKTSIYNKSETLYGLEVAKEAFREAKDLADRTLVVMEGYTDCVLAWQAGYPFAVATCGTALTEQHLLAVRRYAKNLVIMFDGDRAGQDSARKALKLFIASDLNLRFAALAGGMDPADFVRAYGGDALRAAVERADDAVAFMMAVVRKRHDFATMEGKKNGAEELFALLAGVPALASMEGQVRFNLAVREVVEATGVPEPAVRRRIDEIRRGQRPHSPPALAADAPAAPMKAREKQIAQWLVAQPAAAAPALSDLGARAEISHPQLQALADAAFAVYAERGTQATFDDVRERLNDLALVELAQRLAAQTPDGEDYESGLAEIAAALAQRQRRNQSAAARGELAAGAADDEHVEWLRRRRGAAQ